MFPQSLLSETRSRAKRQHDSLAGLCGKYVSASPCALPVYRQPSDLPALQHLQSVYKNGFRRQLIKYIHRRKRAEKARLRILARQYARDAQVSYDFANNMFILNSDLYFHSFLLI